MTTLEFWGTGLFVAGLVIAVWSLLKYLDAKDRRYPYYNELAKPNVKLPRQISPEEFQKLN